MDYETYGVQIGTAKHFDDLLALLLNRTNEYYTTEQFRDMKKKWGFVLTGLDERNEKVLFRVIKHKDMGLVGVVIGLLEYSVIREPLSVILNIVAFTVNKEHKRALPILMQEIELHVMVVPYIDYVKFTTEPNRDTLDFIKRGYEHYSTSYVKSREGFLKDGW